MCSGPDPFYWIDDDVADFGWSSGFFDVVICLRRTVEPSRAAAVWRCMGFRADILSWTDGQVLLARRRLGLTLN